MPTLITDQGATVTQWCTYTVETIDYLGAPGGWTVVPHLFVNSLNVAVNAIDSAELVRHLGNKVIQPGQNTFADYQPLVLKGKFVRITIDPEAGDANLVWVGYVLSDDVMRDGVEDVAGTNKLTGADQVFQCVGLEWFLDRKQIDSSVVRKTGATPDWLRIYRPQVFNGGAQSVADPAAGPRANRSPELGDAGVYDFADNFNTAQLWTARQIADHCLAYHTLTDDVGNPAPCQYILHPATTAMLDGFAPTAKSEHRTVFEILNDLAKPQRGLVWYIEYDDALTLVRVIVQSLATAAIALAGGGTLPANNDQETLDFDSELDVSEVKVRELGMRDYHLVVVRGARMTSTMTLGIQDAQTSGTTPELFPDWSYNTDAGAHGSELKYKEAAKAILPSSVYDQLTAAEKARRNDAVRLSEAFSRVYTTFRIHPDWDGKSGDGGDSTRDWAMPVLSSTGSITGGLAIHTQGLRLLNTTQLKRGWNYENPLAPVPNSPDASLAELMPPFVLLQTASSGGTSEFRFADRMGKDRTTYRLRMQHSVPGFEMQPEGGVNHALALNWWGGAEPSEEQPEVDFSTLRATVCVEADTYCEGKYPEAGFPANTPLQPLVIDVGEHYRLDFLAANTVIDLRDGQLVRASHAAVLRDDRKYLEDLARMAYEWYRVDRQTLTVSFRQIRSLFALGMMITTIGTGSTAENINTVVSSITFNLLDGTTTVETHDETLDARSFTA